MGNNLHSFPFRRFRVTARRRSTVPSLFATLSSFLSIFEKSRSATDRFYSCVLLRAFPLSRRELCQRSRFMVEFYSRRHEAKQGRRKYAWRGTDPPDYQRLVLTLYPTAETRPCKTSCVHARRCGHLPSTERVRDLPGLPPPPACLLPVS